MHEEGCLGCSHVCLCVRDYQPLLNNHSTTSSCFWGSWKHGSQALSLFNRRSQLEVVGDIAQKGGNCEEYGRHAIENCSLSGKALLNHPPRSPKAPRSTPFPKSTPKKKETEKIAHACAPCERLHAHMHTLSCGACAQGGRPRSLRRRRGAGNRNHSS